MRRRNSLLPFDSRLHSSKPQRLCHEHPSAKTPQSTRGWDTDFGSHAGTAICSLTVGLHYMMLGRAPRAFNTLCWLD